jgi:hypothetical protein
VTAEDFSHLSVDRRLAALPDRALIEMHAVTKRGASQPTAWRVRIAWPNDLPREHAVLAFTHATRPSRTAAVQACAERIRARCLAPCAWGITVLELGRLLLYWESRAKTLPGVGIPCWGGVVHRIYGGALDADSHRAVLDDLLVVLEANARLRAEIDGFCPGLVERLRRATQPAA